MFSHLSHLYCTRAHETPMYVYWTGYNITCVLCTVLILTVGPNILFVKLDQRKVKSEAD